MFDFAYLIGTLILGLVWLPLFLWRHDVRKEMLMIGLVIGSLAPLWAPWFFHDYWYPTYALWFGVEDFLYGFFAGGIVSVIYEEVYARKLSRRKLSHDSWWVRLAAIGICSTVTFNVLLLLNLNSIYAAICAFIVFFAGVAHFRPDLVQDAIASGVLFTLATFVVFSLVIYLYPGIVNAWWKLENLSGALVYGIPLEELLWAFSMGIAGGPLYEFVSGRRLISHSRSR